MTSVCLFLYQTSLGKGSSTKGKEFASILWNAISVIAYLALIMSPPHLGETYCFCSVRAPSFHRHTLFLLNILRTIYCRAFIFHMVIGHYEDMIPIDFGFTRVKVKVTVFFFLIILKNYFSIFRVLSIHLLALVFKTCLQTFSGEISNKFSKRQTAKNTPCSVWRLRSRVLKNHTLVWYHGIFCVNGRWCYLFKVKSLKCQVPSEGVWNDPAR